MPIKKILHTATLTTIVALLYGCSSTISNKEGGGYYQDGIYFGEHLSKAYVRGVRDGCQTAKGEYTKSHWFFQRKKEYVEGWFIGRNKCRGLLKIDENGDLVLPEKQEVSTESPAILEKF